MFSMNKLIILLGLIFSTSCQVSTTETFSTMEGIQVYLLKSDTAYMYATLTGDNTEITIQANLYLAAEHDTVVASNGYWMGMGFNKTVMADSDMVVFTYSKGTFDCEDYFGEATGIKSDVSLDGNDGVTKNTDTAIKELDTTWAPYKTHIKWTCTKSFTVLDDFDFGDFENWKTNKANVIGAYGLLSSTGVPQQHIATNTATLTIVDGSGGPKTPGSGSFLSISLLLMALILGLLI